MARIVLKLRRIENRMYIFIFARRIARHSLCLLRMTYFSLPYDLLRNNFFSGAETLDFPLGKHSASHRADLIYLKRVYIASTSQIPSH